MRSLAFIKLLAALYEHHSRPKELIIRYDLPGRLRSLCVPGAGAGVNGGGGALRGGAPGAHASWGETEAAAAAGVQAAAEKLLSGMRLNKI